MAKTRNEIETIGAYSFMGLMASRGQIPGVKSARQSNGFPHIVRPLSMGGTSEFKFS
ncbi:hypothetical protein GCM10017044_15140 [Kordiimonas sediminis]|uniref:Uncharacterized protein n=1 Tax=Kordiimonas sediminis TaxID=1735581 RepID=A0A919AR16_9PROT|nr:hypothetical protein [Kordiimonas sediminis]GHF21168.1 hypothetical protein GCM10017044_15140 [Kordiimonas sediminis]